ncbi:hypothetical protein [Catellatospora tritici]
MLLLVHGAALVIAAGAVEEGRGLARRRLLRSRLGASAGTG